MDSPIAARGVDLFGDPIPESARRAPYFERSEESETWTCSFCEARHPISLGIDIVILGPRFMLNFCTPECAEELGYPKAGDFLNRRFALTGEHWIILTDDERIPDPRRPDDLAAYADAIAIYTSARIERPTFEALLATTNASEDAEIEAFLKG